MNSFLNKAIPCTVIGVVSYLGYEIGDFIHLRTGHSEQVESRITQNKSRYIQEQKAIGMGQDNYFKFNFDVPLLQPNIPEDAVALYPGSGNTIYVRSLLLESKAEDRNPYPNTTFEQTIDATAHHEMIHYYMAQTCGCGGITLNGAEGSPERLSQKLITEGVAEYLSLKLTHIKNPLTENDIPVADLSNLSSQLEQISSKLYPLGAVVVQPLLDQFGPDSMCHLYDHPPTTLELLDLRVYQDRMTTEIKSKPAKLSHPIDSPQ